MTSEAQPPVSDLDQKVAQLQATLQMQETQRGANSYEVALVLDQIAAVLREKKALLEATNVEARSRMIKKSLGIPTIAAASAVVQEVDIHDTAGARAASAKLRGAVITVGILFVVSIVTRLGGNYFSPLKMVGWFCLMAAFVLMRRAFDMPLQIRIGALAVWAALLFFFPQLGPTPYRGQISPADFDKAYALYKDKRFEGAMQIYDQMVATDPRNAGCVLARAHTELAMKRFDAVIADCDKALYLKKDLPLAYLLRGTAYQGLNKHAEALQDFDRCAAFESEDVPKALAWWNRSFSDEAVGNVENARNSREEARKQGVSPQEEKPILVF